MKKVLKTKVLFVSFVQLMLSCSLVFMIEKSHANSFDVLHAALPDQINGWSAEPEDSLFDHQTIFNHIDGEGEVYRAYNMQKCLSRRYIIPNGPGIVLDIFDMGTSEDAFGVFTQDQDGESVDVGQGALYRFGWLSFWKHRFFVSIYAEEETLATEKALKKLGKVVASLITGRGRKPRIISHLPPEGLQPRSIRYFHHHMLLNHHFYLSNKNILNLGPHTDAVLAQYQREEEFARLLLVTYPNDEKGENALASFLRHYLPEAGPTAATLLENGKWCSAVVKGKLLAIVLEADSRKLSESLLNGVTGNP